MLRLVSISLFLLLSVYACAPHAPSFYETSEAQRKQWLAQLDGTIGADISTLIGFWGEPEKPGKSGAYEYLWSKRKEFSSGGYYVAGSMSQRLYDRYGYFRGTIETPTKEYVEPVKSVAWCNILINTDKSGIITQVSVEDGFDDRITAYKGDNCNSYFPFPEDFPPK